jgi:hypothetical protein
MMTFFLPISPVNFFIIFRLQDSLNEQKTDTQNVLHDEMYEWIVVFVLSAFLVMILWRWWENRVIQIGWTFVLVDGFYYWWVYLDHPGFLRNNFFKSNSLSKTVNFKPHHNQPNPPDKIRFNGKTRFP